jgi:VWFA-related protein
MRNNTAQGPRAGTMTTTLTRSTNNYWFFVVVVAFVIVVPASRPWAVSPAAQPPSQPPTQAQQRPVFRGGTHFVRVDAYPTQDGKIVEGLKAEDFEILEDGKPQAIESFDFIKFDTFTPEAERRDPSSQRAGFDLAADPRYRLFVVYVDMTLSTSAGPYTTVDDLPRIRQPLVDFFNRIVGPQDLYGFLTSRNSVKDLVLGQKTSVTVEQVLDLWRAKVVDRDDADDALEFCSCGIAERLPDACRQLIEKLKLRHRADATYNNLQDVVRQLGSLRQERKNFVLVTNLLPRWRPDQSLLTTRGPDSPRIGIVNGRVTNDDRNVYTNGGGNANSCAQEFSRLAFMDFEPRYRELLDAARRENVAFYVITPGGLQAPPSLGDQRAMQNAYDDLKSLADNTGGIAVTGTNDLGGAFRRIADDLAAYYLLGYYTTNTRFDGGLRKITVRTKSDRKAIRARSEYRAPTEAEIAAMANSRPAPARAETGPPAVIGEPVAYRVTRAQGAEKASSLLEFVRTDRVRVEWPVLAPLDRREARILDSAGKPLPFDLPVSEAAERKTVVVELALAPFGRGVYSIELTAGSGGKTEQRKLTFMMK